jgi:hypothetical protein
MSDGVEGALDMEITELVGESMFQNLKKCSCVLSTSECQARGAEATW